jgi:AraC-like DNA-binding protein
MPGSLSSVFGEPEDFQAALSGNGVAGLLITDRGQFQARLTQIRLDALRLAAVEEARSRIAFVAVPASMFVVTFPFRGGPSPIWAGIEMRTGEMITLGPDQRLHARTVGPCRWAAVQVPDQQVVSYGRALSGTGFVVPPVARWRPPVAAVRHLAQLHGAAVRMAEIRSGALADVEAAHGLEQQLIHTLIECLSAGPAEEEMPTRRRHRGILAGFEDLLRTDPSPGMNEICAVLGVSERLLRACCREYLRMGPNRYLRLRRMQQVHRDLRNGNPGRASVSEVARRYGFRDPGRFAASYRAVYGELPSATLRRSLRGTTELSLHRPV